MYNYCIQGYFHPTFFFALLHLQMVLPGLEIARI